MSIKIALAGNPNCGKTTLFNALTGSNQFVGNWPGVTVEKKEGRLKGHKDVAIMDLPGIYSLSPYTLEEVVARNYLINERPEPMFTDCEAALSGKKIALFGSYGWGSGEWMDDWAERSRNAGADLSCDPVICNEAPDDEAVSNCKDLGASLA